MCRVNHHFVGSNVYGQDFTNDDIYKVELMCFLSQLISVTTAEIEAHLKKICDEKYVGKRVKCLLEDSDISVIKKFIMYGDYSVIIGKMVYEDEDGRCMVVYQEGKFAEIIPEKKKLPKTKEELLAFWHFWSDAEFEDTEYGLKRFLDQYED